MNLILTHISKDHDGVFGILTDEVGQEIAMCLEHAYDAGLGNGSYTAKLNPGVYKCVRGTHKLHDGIPFETFEIEGVTGHDNILFHVGNYNTDSEGCVLLGRRIVANPDKPTENMITSSRNTFLKFMDLQRNVNEFTLTVKG